MDKRKLRKLDYVAGVSGYEDPFDRDIKRSVIPGMFSFVTDHVLKVDISVLESLKEEQIAEFTTSLSAHPDIVDGTIVVKDYVVKAELRQVSDQFNKDKENTLFGYVGSAANLALRSAVQLEQ